MSATDGERRLEEAFATLRAADASTAPDPARMLAIARAADGRDDPPAPAAPPSLGTPARTSGRRWLLLATAAAVAGLIVAGPDRGERTFVAAVEGYTLSYGPGALESPTDRLLDVPGRDLLGSVPSVGRFLRPSPDPGGSVPRPESRR